MIKKYKKTNKELKDALKNEIAPLVIGLRNEIKQTNTELKKIAEKQVPVNELEIIFDGKKVPSLKGKDAVTPVPDVDYLSKDTTIKLIEEKTPKKGIQYFTEKEIKEFLKKVTPVKGKDYRDGVDAHTPVKGKDYFTKEEVKDFLKQVTPIKGIHFRDGVDGITKTVVEYVDLEPKDIRNKLESLKGSQRLSAKAVKGLEEMIKSIVGGGTSISTPALGGGGGTEIPNQSGQSGKFLTTDGTNLSWATVSSGGISGTGDVDKVAFWSSSSSVDYTASIYRSGGTLISENGFKVFNNNKIILDGDFDNFGWITNDASDTYGYGANVSVYGSVTGNFAFINGEDSTPASLYAGSFITNGGSSSDFVKGDGTLDTNTYALNSSLSSYVPYSGASTTVALGSQQLTTSGLITAGGYKGAYIYPSSDSTTAVQIRQANGSTAFFNADTTNKRIWIGDSSSSAFGYDFLVRKTTGNPAVVVESVTSSSYAGMFFGNGTESRYFQIISWSSASGGPARFGVTNNCNEILSVGSSAKFAIGTLSGVDLIFGTGSTARMTINGGGGITIADGNDFTFGTSSGTKLGGSTSKLSFYGVTAIAKPSAYTQTYSTASKTHSNLTSSDLTGITSSTTGSALVEPSLVYTQSEMQQNFRRIQDQFNALKADATNLKQVVNAVIDDLQALGLVG